MDDAQTPFDLVQPERDDAPHPEREPSSSCSRPARGPLDGEQARRLHGQDKDAPEPSGAWTIPMICIGIALIACCVLIPATEENRRLVYERERLKADLDQINKQTEVNDEFLKRVADDPSLSERLAQRQMKMVREGTSVLEVKGESTDGRDMSPYVLTTLAPPVLPPPYQPRGGILAALVSN